MIFQLIFVWLLLNVTQEVNSSVCSKIHDFKNGLPATIKRIQKNDLVGKITSLLHGMYLKFLSLMPEYMSENCTTRLTKIGGSYIKTSYRPRGCCVNCCLLDNLENYVSFYYYPKSGNVKLIMPSSLKKPGTLAALGFKKSLKTIIVLHGLFEDGYLSISVKAIVRALLKKKEQYNIITIDYSELVPTPWIMEGIDNIKLISKYVAEILILYHKTGELYIENIQIIGMSLGAQFAGHIGKEVGKFKKVARVTGLDPAFAFWGDEDSSAHISKGDAIFVDIIHTTSGLFGVTQPLGDADFFLEYPPGTSFRPGCNLLKQAQINELELYAICDHARALKLYVQTIANPYLFPICKNIATTGLNSSAIICGYIGYAANKNATVGEYHFQTSLDWDFWKKIKNVEMSDSSNS